MPEWRQDNAYLRHVIGINGAEIRNCHARVKRELLAEVLKRTGTALEEKVMTIGFARRAATYNRADLLFSNPERLKWITQNVGPLQVIYGGKAHPSDEGGKGLIRRIVEMGEALKQSVRVVYLENFDWRFAPLLYGGVDLWLNAPKRPQEASGTSGMKAALNGVPSLSVLDGWWVEGCLEGITGWAIGHGADGGKRRRRGRLSLRQAGNADPSHVLRAPGPLCRGDALGDRRQRVLLQHQPHGLAVCLECLFRARRRVSEKLKVKGQKPEFPVLTLSFLAAVLLCEA